MDHRLDDERSAREAAPLRHRAADGQLRPRRRAQQKTIRFVPRAAANDKPACPRCGSVHTERLAQFGSTACKALYRCLDCREPFDYFKPY